MCKCTPAKPGRFCGVGRCSIDKWDYSRPFADPVQRQAAPPPPAPTLPPKLRIKPKPPAEPREDVAKRIAQRRAKRAYDREYDKKRREARAPLPPRPADEVETRIAELQAKPRPSREEKLELSHLLMLKLDGHRTEKRLRVPF